MIDGAGGRQGVPPVFLAPMAGISDLPFRSLALRLGTGRVVSEMVASGEVLCGQAAARARAEIGAGGSDTAVQIAGRDAASMAEAARFCAGEGARTIDINFGCPAKKVTGGWSGAALMRVPDHALRLIDAVVAAVPVPVTVKMRLGWDADSLNAAAIAQRAASAGIRMITVHGRTRAQGYRGRADWSAIGAVVAAAGVPVIANGDVSDLASARAALTASGAAGLMVGRAARGRPWLPGQIAAGLARRPIPAPPRGASLCELIVEHYEAMLGFYGREIGLRVARKHLGWYLDAIPGASLLRRQVLVAVDPAAVIATLRAGLDEATPRRIAA